MKSNILEILQNYSEAIKLDDQQNIGAIKIRNDLPKEIVTKSSINTDRYTVRGSSGAGHIASIPWVAVFDEEVTTIAQKGYYIVYLFKHDMSGLYLSLNQGFTYFDKNYDDSKGLANKVSKWLFDSLKSKLNDFDVNKIDLKHNGKLAKGYEAGHILGKYYSINSIPSDQSLIDDLRNLIGVYRELKAEVGIHGYDSIVANVNSGKFKLKPSSWREEIIQALTELGGAASYKDIYQQIIDRNVKPINGDWRASVRGCIERNSSDSETYQGKNDIFYAVYGIGKGYWGLRVFSSDVASGNITEDDLSFPEGKKKLRVHVSRERNPKVIKEAKRVFKDKHGKVFCEVCGFDFEALYGELGKDFIEGHHSIPVSDLDHDGTTHVKDIVMVCSNCHRMLHKKRPWLKKEDLKSLI